MKIDEKELVECLRGFALGLRGAGHIAGAELIVIAADRVEKLEMDLEVTGMNLGNAREECNRLEYENEDLRKDIETLNELLREAREKLSWSENWSMPNDWGEYGPEFPREGM